MTILAGLLAGERDFASRWFDLDEALPTLSKQGIDLSKNWHDEMSRLTKFGRSAMPGDWVQPPKFDPDHRLAILADARLHDRESLMAALGQNAADNPTDLTLILSAYRKWGSDCPKHLLGDYVFAIWDPVKRTLFCARDHIGAKPFYFATRGSAFAFANDLGVILDSATEPFALDEEWIASSLTNWGDIDVGRTFFRGVKTLPPGHSLTLVGSGAPRIVRYWHPEAVAALSLESDQDYAEALHDLVDRAVGDCLYSPQAGAKDGHATGLGMHVSGGLDSSAIAILAMRRLEGVGQAKPEAFCWQPRPTPESRSSPEHQWLEAIVEQERLTLNYFQPDLERLYHLFVGDTLRSPMERTFTTEVHVQAQAKTKDIGMILSGWGGDELASHNGRTYYPWLFRTGRWHTLAQNLRDFDGPFFKRILTHAVLPSLPSNVSDWLLQRTGHAVDGARSSVEPLLNQDWLARSKTNRAPQQPKVCSVREMQMFLLNNGHMTARIESWAIHGRKQALEYRYPLLDRRVMEFALSMLENSSAGGNGSVSSSAMPCVECCPTELSTTSASLKRSVSKQALQQSMRFTSVLLMRFVRGHSRLNAASTLIWTGCWVC